MTCEPVDLINQCNVLWNVNTYVASYSYLIKYMCDLILEN